MSILSDYKDRDKLSKLAQLARELQEMINSDLSWEEKFDLVFATNRTKVQPALQAIGKRMHYYDPDTSYEEDARAYVTALCELARVD